jgi:hypothetical protein
MRFNAGSRRIGRDLLLIALAIQGLTPDSRDLSSPRLIRLIACKSHAVRSGEGPPPLQAVDHLDGPDAVCAPVVNDQIERIRLRVDARPFVAFTPPRPCERWLHSAGISCHLFGAAARGSRDRIRSLCRLLI